MAGDTVVFQILHRFNDRGRIGGTGVFNRLGHHVSRIVAQRSEGVGRFAELFGVVLDEGLHSLIAALRRIVAAVQRAVQAGNRGSVNLLQHAVPAVATQQLRLHTDFGSLHGNQRDILIVNGDEQHIGVGGSDVGQLRLEVHVTLVVTFLGDDLHAQDDTGNGRIILLYSFLLMILLVSILILNYQKKIVDKLVCYDLFAGVFCVIMGIAFSKNVLLLRIIWPFMSVLIVLLPNLFAKVDGKTRKILYTGTTVVLAVYCIWFLVEDKSGIVPYVPFWKNM